MKIEKTPYQTICDTVGCNKYSIYSIFTYSYKGDMNLCLIARYQSSESYPI